MCTVFRSTRYLAMLLIPAAAMMSPLPVRGQTATIAAARAPTSSAMISRSASELVPSLPIPDLPTVALESPALLFHPLRCVDPRTGKPVGPRTVLRLEDGSRIRAGELYATLNDYKRRMNARGLEPQPGNGFQEVGRLDVDPEQQPTGEALEPQFHAAAGPTSWRPFEVFRLGSDSTLSAAMIGSVDQYGTRAGTTLNVYEAIPVSVFGNRQTLASLSLGLNAPAQGTARSTLRMQVLGYDVVTRDQSGTNILWADEARKAVDVSAKFRVTIIGIPVQVRVGANGNAGASWTTRAAKGGIAQAAVRCSAQANTYGEAAAEFGPLGAGIGATLTLFDGGESLWAHSVLEGTRLNRFRKLEYNANALSGKVYVFIKVPVFNDPKVTLFDWSGWRQNGTLFAEQWYTAI